jgi:hypothetical protein
MIYLIVAIGVVNPPETPQQQQQQQQQDRPQQCNGGDRQQLLEDLGGHKQQLRLGGIQL